MKKDTKDSTNRGFGERALAIVFIAIVVSLSFFLGYMVGQSGTAEKTLTYQPVHRSAKTKVLSKKKTPPVKALSEKAPVAKAPEPEKTKKDVSELKAALLSEPERPQKRPQKTTRETTADKERSIKKGAPKSSRHYRYSIQVGAFKVKAEALSLQKRLKAKGYSVRIISPGPGGKYYRVRVGRYRDKATAETMALKLARTERLQPLVVREYE